MEAVSTIDSGIWCAIHQYYRAGKKIRSLSHSLTLSELSLPIPHLPSQVAMNIILDDHGGPIRGVIKNL